MKQGNAKGLLFGSITTQPPTTPQRGRYPYKRKTLNTMNKNLSEIFAIDFCKLNEYYLQPQEAAFFEWLLTKQIGTNSFEAFRYCYNDIHNEVGINQIQYSTIKNRFEKIGILQTEKKTLKTGGNATYYKALIPNIVTHLHEYVNKESELYNKLLQLLTAFEGEHDTAIN